MPRLATLSRRLADLLLPPLCLHCGDPLPSARPGVCRECVERLAPVPSPRCRRCGLPRPGNPDSCERCRRWPPGLSAVAATPYRGVARSVVAGIKYGGWSHLAGTCAEAMESALADAPVLDALVPVPLHPARLRERGFNQSRLLADALGQRLDAIVVEALVRERATASQVGLDRRARRANVTGAFRVGAAARRMAGGVVGLVDDVTTSGATLAAAAGPLVEAGAASVVGVSFALAFEGGPA